MIIAFSLGNIHDWDKSKNKQIEITKQLDIQGIELNLGLGKDVKAFKPTKENKEYLKSLDYISIHCPPIKIDKKDPIQLNSKQELLNTLKWISELYHDIEAQNLIIHPSWLPEKEILNKYDMRISIENVVPKMNYPFEEMKKIIEHYNKELCLDVAHAYLWNKDETKKYVDEFKDIISQIHFSGDNNNKEQVQLKEVTNNFIESLKPIKKLNVPIVMEEYFEKKDINEIKEEIKKIKELWPSL